MQPLEPNHPLEEILKILADIAGTFALTTPEYKALQQAADALLFISIKGYKSAFQQYRREADEELSAEQIAYLRSIGCTP